MSGFFVSIFSCYNQNERMIKGSDTMRGKETRERILEAAIKVISDETIEGLSTRKVSSEANVNLAAIHYHHRSKEGMLIDLARYLMMNYITPKLESCMVNGKKPKELFADIYRSIESLYDENPEVLISFVYLWLHGRKSRRIKEIILNSREELTEKLITKLTNHMSLKRAKKVSRRFNNQLFGYILDLTVVGEKLPEKEVNELAARLA